MDRPLIYTQEQGRSTDFLFGMRAAMVGLAKLSAAVLGTGTIAHGLPCTPTIPASMQVNVGAGEIYALTNLDGTDYGVLPADTTDQILKQGILLGTAALSCPAPTSSGQSINYLIEAAYQDSDTNPAVLPYFNSNNPEIPLNGPGGLGGTNATQRQGLVVLTAKAGAAATTGTQLTPAADAGNIGLFVVTVAFGATTITAGNISQYSAAPFVSSILQMMQTNSTAYDVDTSGAANAVLLTMTPPLTAYTDGQLLCFKAANSNTGNTTINAGPGAITLTGPAGALQGGEIIALKQYVAMYSAASGTAILIGQTGGALQINPATQPAHAVPLAQAQAMLYSYAVATGTANAVVVALTPALAAYVDGAPLRCKIASTNTGAATLNVNGLGTRPIVGLAQSALQGGELFAGGYADFEYSASLSSFILKSCSGGALQVSPATQSQHAAQLGQMGGQYIGSLQVLSSISLTAAMATFTVGGRSVQATTSRFRGQVAGGGGGGALPTGAGQASAGGGGNAGNPFEFVVSGITFPVSITVGAPGTGSLGVAGTFGVTGGDLVVGSYATIKGGLGGPVGGLVGAFPAFNGLSGQGSNPSSTFAAGVKVLNDGIGQVGNISTLLSASAVSPGQGGTGPYGSVALGSGGTSGYGVGGVAALNGVSSGSGKQGGTAQPALLMIDFYS